MATRSMVDREATLRAVPELCEKAFRKTVADHKKLQDVLDCCSIDLVKTKKLSNKDYNAITEEHFPSLSRRKIRRFVQETRQTRRSDVTRAAMAAAGKATELGDVAKAAIKVELERLATESMYESMRKDDHAWRAFFQSTSVPHDTALRYLDALLRKVRRSHIVLPYPALSNSLPYEFSVFLSYHRASS